MISKKSNSKSLWILFATGLGLILGIYLYLNSGSLVTSGEMSKSAVTPSNSFEPEQTHSLNPQTASGAEGASAPPSNSTQNTLASEQLRILEELLKSHNDNDPRMDRELLVLSETAKAMFREKYRSLPAEKRNDRGTIVFLIGRNLSTAQDFAFLDEVIKETPCLSLDDCTKAETGGQNRENDEHQGGFAVSLAYPQLVALHSLEGYLKGSSKNPLAENARNIVAGATHSTIPEISKMAEGIQGQNPH